jgi:hypothetical protein
VTFWAQRPGVSCLIIMKIKKRVLCPERLRRIPGQFSWIDQLLIRDRYLHACDHSAWALYLVLVTVGDAEGLSYYSEASLERMLRLERPQLLGARQQLCQAGLIAYQAPLYQVLSLQLPVLSSGVAESNRAGEALSAAQLLNRILKGAP